MKFYRQPETKMIDFTKQSRGFQSSGKSATRSLQPLEKRKQMRYLLIWLSLSIATTCLADNNPLDFWDEETRLFGTAQQNQHVDAGLPARRNTNYKSIGFSLDHADKREGDFSILYKPSAVGMAPRFGFVASLWGERWELSPGTTLHLWVKVQDASASDHWRVRLVDQNGQEATGVLSGIGSEWKDLSLPLNTLQASSGFDWSHVALCEFEAQFSKEALIHLDGVCFIGSETKIGVTDKPLAQRMAEAKASRTARVEAAFKLAAKEDAFPVVSAFAKMLLNEDLDTANQLLADELKKPDVAADSWSLLHTPLYCRFYYMFSNRCGKFPGRMKPEVEKLLLETLWERTAAKNDIAWARQSTWWLDGSENHDLNAKVCNLVTSRIFMNEPDYKDRVYPDYGFGGGYHYGHAGYYGPGIDPETRHGGGRADLSDGKQYTAKDHYAEWLKFMKKYFCERARRGFFLENAAYGYSKHTLNMVDLTYQYGGDDELHRIVGDFITLYWADWAQVSISGVRGGPKTRYHKSVGGDADKATADLIGFHLGGPGNAACWWYWNLINEYQLPDVVWSMALDREGMGSFVYKSRGIGEEENVWPRPMGTERTLLCDTESRFLKYTYITPDYTLGTQMDHPAATHSHLSIAGRWHGMTFALSADSRIVPIGLVGTNNTVSKKTPADTEIVLQTVQQEQTLIVQQARRWFSINPEWYPASSMDSKTIGIYFGSNWDQRVEKDGWIFVQKGNAYAAVRPILWDEKYEKEHKTTTGSTQANFNAPNDIPTVQLRDDCYRWNEDRTVLILEDKYSPVIIQAGRVADYPALENFMADVLDNPIALYKTVVPGSNILVYKGCGKKAEELVFNAGTPEIPTIGSKPVNYNYPMTFDSPYLQSEYKSGKIQIQYGDEKLKLDFSNKTWWKIWR